MSEGTLAEVLAGSADWTVVEGDCLEVLPTIPDKGVAHVITDPPYSERVHGVGVMTFARSRSTKNTTAIGFSHATAALRDGAGAAFGRVASRWVLVFCDVESVSDWTAALPIPTLRIGAWVKVAPMPQITGDRPAPGFEAIVIAHRLGRKRWNGGGAAGMWHHSIEHVERLHVTPKPVPLMLDLVSDFTDSGELILDAFAGSGTTGVACLRLGRRFIGIEKDPKYAAVARERMRAEGQGLSLRDARAGQLSLLGDNS